MSISTAKTRALLGKIAGRRILVIGDVMLDHYLWGDATRISPEAPVPVVEVKRDTYVPGGAANVALNCASLGAKTTVAGYIGEDDAGARLMQLLRASGVKAIRTAGHAHTIVKTRVIIQRQQLCRLDREAAPADYQMDAADAVRLLRRAIAAADAVVISDYAKGLVTNELIAAVAAEAHAHGKFVALDPKPKRSICFEDLDLITPNRREAAQLAGVPWTGGTPFPAEEICRIIHERHRVKNLVVTLSEDGLLLSREGRVVQQIPTAAREVFDVSGAGDTSIAGLVLALSAGADLETAAHFANAASGVVVGKIGTATVTPQELLAYVSHTP
jgi:D-beta-D-heptose 7-phosphate kinase/D-beta-D-heptose 1-phosphate adenosyltransferase